MCAGIVSGVLGSTGARAQDTVPPVEQGVRIGITYRPGVQPGMLVLRSDAGELVDSVETILHRDLDFSDRFEIISLPGGDRVLATLRPVEDIGSTGPSPVRFVNYPLYAALGADFAIEVEPADSMRVVVTLYDVRGESERRRKTILVGQVVNAAFRMVVHRVADDFVGAATGEPGHAASRILFVRRGRLYRVDADGATLGPAAPAEHRVFSPAWDPSGRRFVYTALAQGWGKLVVADAGTAAGQAIGVTEKDLNFSAAFSPDGQVLTFARSGADGTDIYSYNIARDCCLQRLTVGRFSDNLSPTFSPDGRRIAYVSTRAGPTQIYVMAADGTGQELFAPFDYGVTGSSNAPEWSRDGTRLVFHRDVAGSPQVFVMETQSRVVRQLTSAGRNEDPTWAPDGRHIAFVSNRTGVRQLWVIDIETGRVRQLTKVGDVRLPAWSPRLHEPTKP